ncbi:hypothetical protein ACFYOT_01865 [Saccharothrix saharensis]|uniref:hypothetical protein n=1 Tax=Saccharothrix saharensis TaxID=571190 RepID=UPI0036A7AAC5
MDPLSWQAAYSVIDHVSTVASIPLATIGFFVAYVQIRKTRKAAEATRAAVESARTEMSRAGVLTLLPQLQRIEEQMERAVSSNSVELFLAWSNTWRFQAGELKGHLEMLAPGNEQLPTLIQKSVGLAGYMKTALDDKREVDLRKVTRKTREAVAAVTNELGSLVAVYGAAAIGGTNAVQ